MKSLSVDYNSLKIMTPLRFTDPAYNRLDYLTFQHNSLDYLTFQHNDLELGITPDAFSNLTNLTSLNLRKTHVTTIDFRLPSSLTNLIFF